jgi:DNA mismatch endonuclease (patch repair protein)
MARVKGKNTTPELRVRKTAHAMGLRFRLHRSDLPSKPDIVLPKRKAAIFVHGCFWHRHPNCKKASIPRTRTEFWQAKFDENQGRDARVAQDLTALGWQVVTVWACETKDESVLRAILTEKSLPVRRH